jgi:hypothetical protein
MRSFVRWCGLLLLGGLLLLLLSSLYGPSRTPAFGGSPLSSHSMTVVAFSSSSASSVIGGPSLSAAFIDRVLARYGSPAVGLGRALVADSQYFQIDDAYALAFFLHESTFGTSGVARVTRSLGNIICSGYAACFQGFRLYPSWQVGALDWFRLIRYEYLPRGLTTVQAIVPVYAPALAGNNPAEYIVAVVQAVATWRAGRVVVSSEVVS